LYLGISHSVLVTAASLTAPSSIFLCVYSPEYT
jgi:hypothetical protein